MTRSRIASIAVMLVGFGALVVAPASPAAADLEVSFGYRTPALTRAADDRLTLFATDGADRVWQRAQTAPGADTWTGWTEVGGRMRTLAAETATDGRITLAGLDRTGRLFLRGQATPGGAFTDWAAQDDTLAAIGLVRNPAGTLDLFGTTAAGTLSRRRLPDGAWQAVFADVRTFAVETDGAGRVGVFYIHNNGLPYARSEETPGGGWAPYRGLGGHVTALAAARNSAGALEFFGTDAAGRIQHRRQPSPGPGQPWEAAEPLAGRARSLAAESNADGRIELVGLENVGSAYHQWQRPGGWSPWTRLPGDLAATYADGGTVTALDGNINETPVGRGSAITTAADGLGLISYSDALFADLKVAHCGNPACTTATTTKLDPTLVTSRNTAITTNRTGYGVIAYTSRPILASTSADLKVAFCENLACTSARSSVLDVGSVADGPLSVTTVGYGNNPLVVFRGSTSGNRLLRLAYCDVFSICETVAARTIGIAGNPDSAPTVATGPDGLGLIVWEGREGTERLLNVSHCRDESCSAFDTVVVDRDPAALGGRNSVTFGADGLPLIAYGKGNGLYLVHCTTATCAGAGAPTPVDSGFEAGAGSIRVGDDGLGIISYHDRTNGVLRAAHCGNVACTTSTKVTFARVGTDPDPAMTIGSDGLPLVSHYNSVAGTLTVAHCANVRCVSFRVPPALTPPPLPADGVRGVQVWNCGDRPAAMWANDKTAGTGWTRIATQPINWPAGPECGLPAYSGEPWTFAPAAGHVYDIRAVDYTAPGCVDNPEYAPCWRLDKRDVLGHPNGALHRDVALAR